ncbi:MAG: Rne/Rng family ribonuclease [Rhabdochlamydiaceae bacterium]|nr:Rne/Rng family ribonuclease [Candidatus Amphrikana amoebophyrae]
MAASKVILLNIESKEMRLALLKAGLLHDLVVERKKSRQLTGNIYKGHVINILKNIQSAFLDIGEGDNGFIHISDILENTQKFKEMFDMDFDWESDISHYSAKKKQEEDISKLLKKDQPVLVQVVKEPIGTKGARLTSNVSMAGRYLVMLPNNPHRGVSRKIQDQRVRDRLKKLIRAFEMPNNVGLICRTASASATNEALIEEATDLINQWNRVVDEFHAADKPSCLFQESDLVKKALITAIDKKYDRLIVDNNNVYQILLRLYKKYANDHNLKIEFYRDKVPMFDKFGVEREIDKALKRKIWLPSGGYLYFDRTEAMHTVDVNSGRSTQRGGSINSVEETLVKLNMEAAEETARQLRIRNIGGLVICDFIDMQTRKNQRRVLDHFKDCLKGDSARCTVLGMSEFGLVEMTRQRSRESLSQTLFTSCPYCSGNGMVKNHESVSIDIERALVKLLAEKKYPTLSLTYHPQIDHYLSVHDKEHFERIAHQSDSVLEFKTSDHLHINAFEFYEGNERKAIEL